MDLSQMGANPFLSGGLVLMILGGLLAYFRNLPSQAYHFLERFFVLKIEIMDEDESYSWMQVWLADKLKDTLSVSVITKRSTAPSYDKTADRKKPKIYFVPAVGTYFFWYQGKFVSLYRDRKENMSSQVNAGTDKNILRAKESFTIRIWTRKKSLASDLIEECRKMASPEDGKIEIRTPNYNYWTPISRTTPRPLNSVILDGNQIEVIRDDMQKFIDGYDWYQKTGVPYRRNYLFYGPPGSGKSSAIKALAGHFDMNIYLMSLSDPDMGDSKLSDLFGKVADRNILLLEDIDCAFKADRTDVKTGGLTFSGLLNGIDGVASGDGKMVFMTTNHIERLDDALLRPGRADVKVYFGHATQLQAKLMFDRFFPDHADLAHAFRAKVLDKKYSMATIQNYLMLYRDDPEGAITNTALLNDIQNTPELPPVVSTPADKWRPLNPEEFNPSLYQVPEGAQITVTNDKLIVPS